jgi:hypothetical protein
MRNLAIGIPLVLAGLLIVFVPIYSRMHRNPAVRVQGTQTWAVTDPRYPEAYHHAAVALLEVNPGLTPDRVGGFDPARVTELGDSRYRVRVPYQRTAPSGVLIGNEAECTVRVDGDRWSVESAETVPELSRRAGPTAEILPAAPSQP